MANRRLLGSCRQVRFGILALTLLPAVLAGCGDPEDSGEGIDIRWKDESQVQTRVGEGDLTIPEFQVGECGNVSIEATLTETAANIEFEFEAVEPPPEGCCEAYGWIQHVDRLRKWTYDNGAGGQSIATGVKYGPPSDPAENPQPVGTDNLWFGGYGNVTDGMASVPEDWDENAQPQTTIRDSAGCNESHAYVTQLVCVETGTVLFEYRWRLQPQGDDCEFHGAEGDNISFDLAE